MDDFLKRPQTRNARLRELLRNKPLIVPGAHDGLSARLVEQAGFDAVYMGGYATTGALLGRPDMSLLTGTEMIENARRMAQAVGIPMIADADTGYGNAINVIRTVHDYEQTGVSGIHLEDQTAPKRCGHMAGKNVITAGEMVGKVRAAVAARSDPDFVIIARTDALAIHGVEDAVERGRRYADAGADVIWVEAPTTEAQIEKIAKGLSGITLLLNWLEHGETPNISLDKIKLYGFGIVIYPVGSVFTVLSALREHYASVRKAGTPIERLSRLPAFDDFTAAVGKPEIDKLAEEFARSEGTEGLTHRSRMRNSPLSSQPVEFPLSGCMQTGRRRGDGHLFDCKAAKRRDLQPTSQTDAPAKDCARSQQDCRCAPQERSIIRIDSRPNWLATSPSSDVPSVTLERDGKGTGGTIMKQRLVLCVAAISSCAIAAVSWADGVTSTKAASPIYGVTIPDGYRQWELIAPALEAAPLNEIRAIVGNKVAVEAYGKGTLPFPDGTILVKLAWKQMQSPEFEPATIPGNATTVQVMVKDSKRYAATGGWGFGRFINGKPVDEAQHRTCFACHEARVKNRDYVFTAFAP